jgi:two-component system LytT family sensor kinase
MNWRLPTLRSWGIYFSAWTIVGAVYLGQNVTRRLYHGDTDPWQDLGYWVTQVYVSALLTPLILWAGRRWALERHNWLRQAFIHLGCSILFGFVRILLEGVLNVTRDNFFPQDPRITFAYELPLLMLFSFHSAVIAYWAVLAIQIAHRNWERYQERAQAALRLDLHASQLEAQVAQARLGALKAQLQPHFLFNTLNAIVVLVRQQKGRQAEETLERFSDLLRAVVEDLDAQEVPLARELQYLKLYLAIEQLRFSDRMRVSVDIDADLLDAAVPHMVLQPIVENAIKHGLGKSATAGRIDIRAARVGDSLHITVRDDGPGFSATRARPDGIGIANTRARLKQLYGGVAELRTADAEGGGALVTVILPFRIDSSVSEAPRSRELAHAG